MNYNEVLLQAIREKSPLAYLSINKSPLVIDKEELYPISTEFNFYRNMYLDGNMQLSKSAFFFRVYPFENICNPVNVVQTHLDEGYFTWTGEKISRVAIGSKRGDAINFSSVGFEGFLTKACMQNLWSKKEFSATLAYSFLDNKNYNETSKEKFTLNDAVMSLTDDYTGEDKIKENGKYGFTFFNRISKAEYIFSHIKDNKSLEQNIRRQGIYYNDLVIQNDEDNKNQINDLGKFFVDSELPKDIKIANTQIKINDQTIKFNDDEVDVIKTLRNETIQDKYEMNHTMGESSLKFNSSVEWDYTTASYKKVKTDFDKSTIKIPDFLNQAKINYSFDVDVSSYYNDKKEHVIKYSKDLDWNNQQSFIVEDRNEEATAIAKSHNHYFLSKRTITKNMFSQFDWLKFNDLLDGQVT